jgi:hypothetical protein
MLEATINSFKNHVWRHKKILDLVKNERMMITLHDNKMSLYYIMKHSLYHHTFTLKKDVKMYESETASMLIASNVESPPL